MLLLNNVMIHRFIFLIVGITVVSAGPGAELHAADDLILSLEEVIGTPPEKTKEQKRKNQQLFYTLDSAEEDPEMEDLIRNQQMGFVLTAEEQVLLNEYQMGGRISGANPLIRRIYPPVLSWVETRVKVASGDRYSFINCYPHASGPFPVALVLDPEIGPQFEAGTEEYNQVVRRMPIEAELPYNEAFRGRYITNNPIGNQLISHAISVIIPIRESLENANALSTEDWKSVLDYYISKKYLDSNSLFLVATKEFADLAIRLASAYPFAGLIMEEPETGLFNITLPTNTEDSMKMASIRETYISNLNSLQCPLMLLRNKENPVFKINDSVLLQPLIEMNKQLFLSLTDNPLRTLEKVEEAEADVKESEESGKRFAYDYDAVEKLSNRMLYFIQKNGEMALYLLPEESTEPRMRNRSGSALAELERIEGRLQGYLQDSQNFDLNGDLSNDGSVSGGAFDDSGTDIEQ